MVEDQISAKVLLCLKKKQFQVGPAADGYVLTVGEFNDTLSTLGDSMYHNNGSKFTTK